MHNDKVLCMTLNRLYARIGVVQKNVLQLIIQADESNILIINFDIAWNTISCSKFVEGMQIVK